MHRDLNERKDRIFDLIVTSYIDTAEPVGSRTISRRYDIGLSPASIRNVMSDLEEQGLIEQPHTSAGRVPTDKGYRYWVDCLMEPEALTDKEKRWISDELSRSRTLESLANRVSKVVSEMTGNAGIIFLKHFKRVSFLNYVLRELVEDERLDDFLEEEDAELFIEGIVRILDQPEFQDLGKMRLLLHAFDEKVVFLQVLAKDPGEQGVQVHIGSENEAGDLRDVSIVAKDCFFGGTAIGGVAVVGPTRMKYSKIVSTVDFMADRVSEAVGRF